MSARCEGTQKRHGLGERHFLLLLFAAYALAAAWPALGLAAKQCTLARIDAGTGPLVLSVPMALLGALLFNAGLGTSARQLIGVIRSPMIVLAGLTANLLVPIAFLAALNLAMKFWHSRIEAQNLMLGLAVVAAMPVAGSSTSWSQHSNGNVAVSLGLVLSSTFLSPFTTPLVFGTIIRMTDGQLAELIDKLSGHQTGQFLLACVVVPSAAGLLSRSLLGVERAVRLKPVLRFVNSGIILFLCYCNASMALPQVFASPDWDFLLIVLLAATTLCGAAFATGWGVARLLDADRCQQRSLMFGIGMANNGTGMVLAASSFGGQPLAAIPVLVYNLVQHIVAGTLHWRLNPGGSEELDRRPVRPGSF